VLSASTADEALNALSRQTVHLVITDIRMKWQSGVTLLIKIRQTYPELPVIVITGYPNLISEEDIRHYGADYFFVKPLELSRLREAVRSCLHRTNTHLS
jgi:DNA-binding NtrC family response regulator